MEKKNTGLIIVIVVLALIVGLLGGYLIIDKLKNKDIDTNEGTGSNNNSKNNQIISDTVKINTGENTYDLKLLQKIDTINSYAYVFLKNDSKGLDLYELHKNSPSTKLFSCSTGCSVSEVQIVGKKLYFNLWYYNDKKLSNNLVSIDLETSSFDNIFTTSDLLTVNYAVTGDYLFVGQIGRDYGATKPEYYLKRYNIKTGTIDSFLEDKNMRWSNILYFDNMIYISAYVYDENKSYETMDDEVRYGSDVLKYYTMQLDGSNLKEISEADYNKAFNSVNYIEPKANYDEWSLIYNDKPLSLTRPSREQVDLKFNGENIFTSNTDGIIELYYEHHVNNYNEVLFMECAGANVHHYCVSEKYYIYNFETKELKTVKTPENENSTVIYLK